MQYIIDELRFELENKLIPFWGKLMDKDNGGFYGYVNYDNVVDKTADKGAILNSRILWFFSRAYELNKNEKYLEYAVTAFKFLVEKLLDKECKGLYWMLDYNGKVCDDRKHTYNQAFGIYALSQYYKVTKNEEAIEIALELFNLIEGKCKDEYGYLEEFDRYWREKENEMLSENGVISDKTMNTHLHILEAYTILYEVTKNGEVKNQLLYLLNLVGTKIITKDNDRLKVFF